METIVWQKLEGLDEAVRSGTGERMKWSVLQKSSLKHTFHTIQPNP